MAFLEGQIVAFITILADCIILQTKEKKHLFDFHQSILTFPALKIGRLGVHMMAQKSGIGHALLEYAVGLVVRLNQDLNVGCRFITVDAYPASIRWYEKKGFVFNKQYKNVNKTNPSMRFDILKSSLA